MNIHEYQAKELLARFDAPVPPGRPARTAAQAHAAARALAPGPFVVKAQIHAGGRGKAGGVRRAESAQAVRQIAEQMIGMTLITPQTGPQGRLVRRLYVEKASTIAREFYLSLLIDRARGWPAFVISPAGGVDIEEVAAQTPEAVLTIPFDPAAGLRAFHAARAARLLKLERDQTKQLGRIMEALAAAFFARDLSLIEINPLIETGAGDLLCLDAKISIDDNALFRHPALAALRDPDEEDPAERAAAQHGLSYIKLDGAIGCMVNGAGLAMATMDIIQHYGAAPANFLDVGGGASQEKVSEAFKILLADPGLKAVLVNIFGGIMRCDIIAEGIAAAARQTGLDVPLIVRLAGTNVDKGRAILQDSGLAVIPAETLDDAARKAVAEAG